MTIEEQLIAMSNLQLAQNNLRFFKQGQGSYCEHDLFLGISIPHLRAFVKNFVRQPSTQSVIISDIFENELPSLLQSHYNEVRIVGWLLVEHLFSQKYYEFALKYAQFCGNWNAVDISAPCAFSLLKKQDLTEQLGYELFHKQDLWSVRFSIVLSLGLIRQKEFNYALDICKKNLLRQEDMIRKPIGWMLREIGKKDLILLKSFLTKNIDSISSISLSYSMEHFSSEEKNYFRSMKKLK